MFKPPSWKSALFSAKLAWKRPLFKYGSVVLCLTIIVATAVFLMRVVPAARKNGSFIMHYNIYFGSDDVRTWGWCFLLPAVWLTISLAALAWSFVSYQRDPHLAYSLMIVCLAWSLPWIGALFYLTLINE